MSGGTLIVGLGNPDRGDDAAGIQTARRLSGHLRAHEITDCSKLLDLWAGETSCTVIDATRSGADPGTVTTFDGLAETLPADTFRSTHTLGLRDVVELGRAIGRLPECLIVFGIEGATFELGKPMSPAVEEAVESLVASLAERGA